MDIERILPDDIFEGLIAANSPSVSNPVATIADLSGSGGIYTADGTVGSSRVATITDTLTFSGGTTIHTLTSGGETVTAGTGSSPTGFGAFGDAVNINTAGQFDMWTGQYTFGGNPVYESYIYDNTTFVEAASHYTSVGDFSGVDRPYAGVYYVAPDGVSFTGIEANAFGTRILDQNPLNRLSALSAPDGIAFLSGVGGQGYIGSANQAGFASWIGNTLDPSLADVLTVGNTTGGTDLVVGTGDKISMFPNVGGTGTAARLEWTNDVFIEYDDNGDGTLNIKSIDLGVFLHTAADDWFAFESGGLMTYENTTSGFPNYLNFNAGITAGRQWDFPDASGVILTAPGYNALVHNPTATEDGYVVKWDNTAGEYVLGVDSGVTFYNSDGSITGNRTVTGDESLWLFTNTNFRAITGDGASIETLFDEVNIVAPGTFSIQGSPEILGDIRFEEGANRLISVLDSTGPAGYNLTIAAGGGGTGLGSGGDLILQPGAGGTGGTGGAPGDIRLTGLNVTSGNTIGTSVFIDSGDSFNNTGGNITLTTGNGGGIGAGGDFSITTGTGAVRGNIIFANGSEGTVGHIWTSTGVNGEGEWSPAAATFYSADGSITGPRTVTGDESMWTFDTTDFHVETGDGAFIELQGDVVILSSVVELDVRSGVKLGQAATEQQYIIFSDLGATSFDGTLRNADLTAARTWDLPDASGTLALDGAYNTGQVYTVTNAITDRTFDANSTTIAELSDIVGTLIADLQGVNILS